MSPPLVVAGSSTVSDQLEAVAAGRLPDRNQHRCGALVEVPDSRVGELPAALRPHVVARIIDQPAAMLVQGELRQDPFSGHLFVFRGRSRANLIKIVYWDGTGFCLFTKRLEHGVFLWPPSIEPGETLSLNSAQLSLLIDGVDWRAPEQRWRPAVAG